MWRRFLRCEWFGVCCCVVARARRRRNPRRYEYRAREIVAEWRGPRCFRASGTDDVPLRKNRIAAGGVVIVIGCGSCRGFVWRAGEWRGLRGELRF